MPNAEKSKVARKQLIEGLNEDLSREYQAIISYVNYSQVLKGAAYMNIADELAVHAKEQLAHALKIANHVDYLRGMPSVTPKPVKASEKAEDICPNTAHTSLAMTTISKRRFRWSAIDEAAKRQAE